MHVSEIVFDTYVICPLCQRKMTSLSGTHLQQKHGFTNMRDFKLEYGILMGTALVAHSLRAVMQKHGRRRAPWFRKNVMPVGVEMAKKCDLVPEESRRHSGLLRRGRSWIPEHISAMRSDGWLDLHVAAQILGVTYNYARKCATDGRLRIMHEKGIRFTKPEWVEDTRKLLHENRVKYHKLFFEARRGI